MSAGKGDKPRPVDKKTFDQNYDQIDWKKKESAKECKVFKGKKIFKY